MKRGTQSITLVSLALLTWLATNALGGSGFIGAYMAGLIIAARRRHIDQEAIELANVEAETLSLGVFFILGLAVAFFFPSIGLVTVIYAILSLTVVRMAPVAAALVGAGCGRRSCLFMGWFGPRGLASIVLMLTAMGSSPEVPNVSVVAAAIFTTVLLSVFAHGISAVPAINRVFRTRSNGR